MKPHPRIRKTIKWGGAAVTVLLVVVWIGSGWWDWGYYGRRLGVGLTRGELSIVSDLRLKGWGHAGWESSFDPNWRFPIGCFEYQPVYLGWTLYIPLWAPVVATSFVSYCAWRLDTLSRRRARVGLCPKCNYDRTGLAVGAVCPECGAGGAGGTGGSTPA